MKRLNWLLLTMMCLLISCTKSNNDDTDDPTADCATTAKAFVANVNPIIKNTCTDALCHGTGSINGPGSLLTYNSIFAARATIRTVIANGTMPKNSSLSTAQKNTILCWIDGGAPNN
ncbi:MAG: hypothetical protein SH818_13755 [Saprospiraceae bacterium]|nr:hypothetical protein [Saprospiraceae bacterium]